MMKTVNEKNRVIVFAAIAVLLLGNLLMAGNSKKAVSYTHLTLPTN